MGAAPPPFHQSRFVLFGSIKTATRATTTLVRRFERTWTLSYQPTPQLNQRVLNPRLHRLQKINNAQSKIEAHILEIQSGSSPSKSEWEWGNEWGG